MNAFLLPQIRVEVLFYLPTYHLLQEAGEQGSFTVVLNSKPIADVSFGVSSSDDGLATVSPSSLLFKIGLICVSALFGRITPNELPRNML